MTTEALTRLPPATPDVCRLCSDATWLTDGQGGVHPCCLYWAELEPGRPCLSCEASRAHARRNRRNDYHEELSGPGAAIATPAGAYPQPLTETQG